MPLRLLEFIVPEKQVEQVPELLRDIPILNSWTAGSGEGASIIHALVDSQHVEGASDLLAGHFDARDGFQLIVLPVEAMTPPVEQRDEDETAAEVAAESNVKDPQRISREEMYEDLAQASRPTTVYVAMVVLSTIVAAIGLIRGDIAIIIGAMVIAPLLGPNIALSLACTLGDLDLFKRALKVIVAGAATAAVLAGALGLLLDVDPSAPEIIARTNVDIGDIVLGLAAGAAGSLAFTSGVPTTVVGVMVAVALLPPLVVAGLLVGGGHWIPAFGAMMVLATNIICVNLSAVGTFLLQKVRPRTWWDGQRAKRATRLAVTIWIVMLLLLLGLMLVHTRAGTV